MKFTSRQLQSCALFLGNIFLGNMFLGVMFLGTSFLASNQVYGQNTAGTNTPSTQKDTQTKPFTFTAIPDQDQRHLQQRFSRVALYLSEQLDIHVRYIPVKSYAAAVTAFRNNEVQLAWFGGLSGVQARRLVPGAEAIAQGYEDQFFKTYFIAYAGTGLKPSTRFPVGIKGKTFTFGSKGSTSGRLMPEFYIRDHFDQSPKEVFSRVGFSGDHHKTLELVQSGVYEVGVINYKVWHSKKEAGKIDTSKVSIIWETPTYPDYQWTIRGDLDNQYGNSFKKKVQQALIEMKGPKLLASFPRTGFVEAKNADYDSILKTAQTVGIIDPSL